MWCVLVCVCVDARVHQTVNEKKERKQIKKEKERNAEKDDAPGFRGKRIWFDHFGIGLKMDI